jgi:hypothetical protein
MQDITQIHKIIRTYNQFSSIRYQAAVEASNK